MLAFRELTLTRLRLYLREPAAFFFTLVFPVMLLLLYGAAFGRQPVPNRPGYTWLDVELPALMVLIPATVGLMGVPGTVASEREYGVLKRFAVTPLTPLLYLGADLVAYLLINLMGALLTLLVGRGVYDLHWPSHPWAVLGIFTLGVVAFTALGFTIAAFARGTRTAQVVGMVLFYPMMFLSGVTFPLDLFPAWLQRLANIWPMTHMYRLLLAVWLERPLERPPLASTLMLVGMIMLGGLALRRFRWVES